MPAGRSAWGPVPRGPNKITTLHPCEKEAASGRQTTTSLTVEVLAEPSLAAVMRFEPGSVDRVFLDASHDGASVTEDLVAWTTRLKPDGILAGHDYSFRHPDLCAAVDAFAKQRGLAVRRGPRDIYWLERNV